jgi:hypothetical protein
MPDPVAKELTGHEEGQTVRFDFSLQRSIRLGAVIASVTGFTVYPDDGPSFGTPVIDGSAVDVRFNGPFTLGVEYTLTCEVLTDGDDPLDCSGVVKITDSETLQ